jgi:hypothetical protein
MIVDLIESSALEIALVVQLFLIVPANCGGTLQEDFESFIRAMPLREYLEAPNDTS